ncbi:hypothetical protein BK004_04205 [bacterium CG10_46_32]|nr:MAG: hypothetical protein BK004_04205 [bacterium CG10_46_32]PIR55820.1 MAG: type II toxin-antitoxin system death-on-curing family toxin [Parcubacteria group bacterium CG10_big_fil_rev_8_21_14_0_10_46_32]
MEYLSGEDILVMHSEIVDATGGTHGIRDTELFISIIERPKASFGGTEMHATVFAKAAVYLESLAQYHVFIDGNKRTALAASARFLFVNGYDLTASNTEVEVFVLRTVEEKLGLEEIADWFESNVKRINS